MAPQPLTGQSIHALFMTPHCALPLTDPLAASCSQGAFKTFRVRHALSLAAGRPAANAAIFRESHDGFIAHSWAVACLAKVRITLSRSLTVKLLSRYFAKLCGPSVKL